MSQGKKAALIILDGWGKGAGDAADAIHHAHTPFIDGLYQSVPNAQLLTDGEHVGLPEGQMGNSEVGHLNIGAGRVVYQDLVRINKAIASGSFFENAALLELFQLVKQKGCKLHFMGLVSDGGIHSHINHLKALCQWVEELGLEQVYVHAFTDGRDTDPKSGLGYLQDLEQHISKGPVQLASIVGRYYAMDRDQRWERVAEAYRLMVHGQGATFQSAQAAMEASYANGITDEFVKPVMLCPSGTIAPGDAVVCFNFRTDRCREITQALSQTQFPEHGMKALPLEYLTMTRYDARFKGVKVAFEKDNLNQTLGEVLSAAGKSQVRIAETEKYPHVTFFFSGGREEPFPGEKRLMVNSPKVATYDLQPEMSAYEVRDSICEEMRAHQPDFICLNFANPDMVGHTGDFEAVKKALQVVDACTQQVVELGKELGYQFLIIADHGNADKMSNPDGSPNTAHTTNPVPVFLVNGEAEKIQDGKLADVAPTLLKMMGLEAPEEMNGKALIE